MRRFCGQRTRSSSADQLVGLRSERGPLLLALIAFRAVQGLGAGAVMPMAMTIVGDIYTLEERAKVQGYIASVWAMSSVVGPLIGGVFSQ